jgi:hypothetical protein
MTVVAPGKKMLEGGCGKIGQQKNEDKKCWGHADSPEKGRFRAWTDPWLKTASFINETFADGNVYLFSGLRLACKGKAW